jgi:hypothetical protein
MLLGFIIHSEQEDALSNGNHYINLRPPFGEGDIAIGFYALNWKDNDGVFLYGFSDHFPVYVLMGRLK